MFRVFIDDADGRSLEACVEGKRLVAGVLLGYRIGRACMVDSGSGKGSKCKKPSQKCPLNHVFCQGLTNENWKMSL